MTDTTTEDPVRLAATLEAETLERAGAITFSQARQRIREGVASPVAHLALQQAGAGSRPRRPRCAAGLPGRAPRADP